MFRNQFITSRIGWAIVAFSLAATDAVAFGPQTDQPIKLIA